MLSTSSKRCSYQFSDIAHNITERVNPSKTKSDVYVGLEHLSPDSIHLLKWGHPSDVIGDKFVFRKGDVIFGKRRAYQRKLALADVDGICSAHAMVLRANTKTMLPEFLPFFLSSDVFMERAIGISVGSLSPTINWNTLKSEKFSIPSLEEQKRLVEVLLATDEVIEKIREVGRDLHRYRNALYFNCFLREDLPRRSLQSMGLVNMGQSPESRYCGSDVNGLPFFQGCTDFGVMYPQTSTYCSKPRKTAAQNDILISVRAPVGDVNIATEECCIGRGIAAITPIEVPRIYLFHALKANADKIAQYEQGSTFKAINKKELMNFEIAYLDTSTTQQITRTLESLDTATNDLAEHLSDSRILLSSLVNNQIFGAENV
jgi:type I restriction enzyme S subunit